MTILSIDPAAFTDHELKTVEHTLRHIPDREKSPDALRLALALVSEIHRRVEQAVPSEE